jgi:hypothetical protein
MAAVESPVEAPGSGIGNVAWFWASGPSRFPRGLPPASGLESASLRTVPWQRCRRVRVQCPAAREPLNAPSFPRFHGLLLPICEER